MEDKVQEYKIILLGDPGVGKTTFFLRLREEEFVDTEQRPSASIGVDDLLYEHTVDGTKVKVGVLTASMIMCIGKMYTRIDG
jgi:GTPase SAR1 family protein